MQLTDVHHRLTAMVGEWAGRIRTWLDQVTAPDHSPWRVSITALLDGGFVQQAYEGRLGDRTFTGRVIHGYNSYTHKITAVWIDSFHMSDAMMISEGD